MLKSFLLHQAIYTSVMSNASAGAQAALEYETAKKCMERARNNVVPSTSENISVIADNFEAGNVYPAVTQSCYLGSVKVRNNKRRGPKEHVAIILGSREIIEQANTSVRFVFVDATFRVTPKQARAVSKRGAQVTLNPASWYKLIIGSMLITRVTQHHYLPIHNDHL